MDDPSNAIRLDEVTALQQRSIPCIRSNGHSPLEHRDWVLMIHFCDQLLGGGKPAPAELLRTVHLHSLALQMTAAARNRTDYLEEAHALLKILTGGNLCAPQDQLWLFALLAQLEMLRNNQAGADQAVGQAVMLAETSGDPFWIASALFVRSYTGYNQGRKAALEQAYEILLRQHKQQGDRQAWILLYCISRTLTKLYDQTAGWRQRRRQNRRHQQLLGELCKLELLGAAGQAVALPVRPVFYPFPL